MSKRQVAISIFNSQLANREVLGNTKFRSVVIQNIMKDTESSHSSAAGLYNNAKKKAQEAGDVVPFGRIDIEIRSKAKALEDVAKEKTKKAAKVKVEQLPVEEEQEEKFELLEFAVVDTDNNIVDTFKSKSTAYRSRNKDAGERVMLTEKAQAL